MREYLYQCQHCKKKYQKEEAFLKHKCKQMLRKEELKTPIGQAAWNFYQDWMRAQNRRVNDERTFLQSRYYTSLNKFAQHVKDAELPNPQVFIKMMVKNKYDPTMWTLDIVYSKYLEHLDHVIPPKQLAAITVDTLFAQADELQCDVTEIFDHIAPNTVVSLLRKRKLTPWILLVSEKFIRYLVKVKKENSQQYIILNQVINPAHWAKQFGKKPDIMKMMRDIVAELDI